MGFSLNFTLSYDLKGQKLRELNFSEKFSFWVESSKIPKSRIFWLVLQNLLFTLRIVHSSGLNGSARTACLGNRMSALFLKYS